MAKRMTRRTSITLSPVLEARLRLMGERMIARLVQFVASSVPKPRRSRRRKRRSDAPR